MSTPNPVLSAAAPSLISAVQAIQQFVTTIGPDPAQWPLKVLPAQTVLVGQLGLLLPQVEVAEVGAGFTAANVLMNSWIAKLKAL